MKLGDTQVHPIQAWDARNTPPENGMTLRQYYAGLAMQGMLANPSFKDYVNAPETAISCADLLLAALEKQP